MTTKTETLAKIAREHLFIEKLEVRGHDSLDFHGVGVVGVQRALEAAYHAGQADLLNAAKALLDAKDNQREAKVEWGNLQRAVRAAEKNNEQPTPRP